MEYENAPEEDLITKPLSKEHNKNETNTYEENYEDEQEVQQDQEDEQYDEDAQDSSTTVRRSSRNTRKPNDYIPSMQGQSYNNTQVEENKTENHREDKNNDKIENNYNLFTRKNEGIEYNQNTAYVAANCIYELNNRFTNNNISHAQTYSL